MRKLQQTKRDRSIVLQMWIDPHDSTEGPVLRAMDAIRQRHPDLSTKQILMQAVIFTAEHDGIEVERPMSMIQISQMFKSILQKLDGLVTGGQISRQDATDFVQMAQDQGLKFEDLDPVAQSLARNYVGFSLNDDEDED